MFRYLRIGLFAEFSKDFDKIFFKLTPSSGFTQLEANEKRLTVDIHRSSLKMVGLHICGILNEPTETTKSYSNFNDELRWLCNSVSC